MGIEISIFTTTYNRAYIITELYKSLCNQTNYSFEWIVIDDGSTDNTEVILDTLIKNNNLFPITFIKKKNGGKHRAINDGVKIAKGRLFFIVDSDDQLTNNSIELVLKWESLLVEKDGFAGVSGLRGYDTKKMIGTSFDGKWLDCTSLERKKNNIIGDKAEVFYTKVLKKYPFPEFINENFVEESVVWNQMAYDGYKIRWFNSIIYICNYRDDGLTKNMLELQKRNPHGYAYSLVHNEMRFNNYGRRDIINIYYQYWIVVKESIGLKKASCYLEISFLKLVYVVLRCKLRDLFRRCINRK